MAYPVMRAATHIIPGATFRSKARPTHGGIDLTPLGKGTLLPVYAVGEGVVTIADAVAEKGDTSGKDIAIRLDGDGSIWWYGHLSRVDVRKGERVKDGQQIGLMGTTGNSTGVHLHLERHWPRLNVETDPWPFIKNEPDPGSKASAPAAPAAPAKPAPPAPTPSEETEMYRMRDVANGKTYLVTDRGITHIQSPAHNALFTRLFDSDGKVVDFNSVEILTIAAYLANAGAEERESLAATVARAVSQIESGPSVEDVVEEITKRLAE